MFAVGSSLCGHFIQVGQDKPTSARSDLSCGVEYIYRGGVKTSCDELLESHFAVFFGDILTYGVYLAVEGFADLVFGSALTF